MTEEPQRKIDLAVSYAEATEHHANWPSHGGRDLNDLMKGGDAPDGPQRCLWPACYKELKLSLTYLEPRQRDRLLWSLYHFQEGSAFLYRWMFWRSPPKTFTCQRVDPAVYPPRWTEDDYARYSDGVFATSEEGRRRGAANAKEIHRRIGSFTSAKALWAEQTKRRIRHLQATIDSGELDDAENEKRQRAVYKLHCALEKAKPNATPWDFLHGRPANGPEDVAGPTKPDGAAAADDDRYGRLF